MEKQDEISMI